MAEPKFATFPFARLKRILANSMILSPNFSQAIIARFRNGLVRLRVLAGLWLVLVLSGCSEHRTIPINIALVDSKQFLSNATKDEKDPLQQAILVDFSDPIYLGEVAEKGIRLFQNSRLLDISYTVHSANTLSKLDNEPLWSQKLKPHQLLVLLHSLDGESPLSAAGIFGAQKNAIGVLIDGELLGCLDSRQQAIPEKFGPYDLTLILQPPAQLLSARWIDQDRDQSISEFDHLELYWNREIQIGDAIRTQEGRVPADMFVLPTLGDRLDDGIEPAKLLPGQKANSLVVVLGSRPRLTISGTFADLNTFNKAHPASGIAIAGTSIRPFMGVVDRYGQGVADPAAIDIEGFITRFRQTKEIPTDYNSALRDHTLTSLANNHILICGGRVTPPGERPQTRRTTYLYNSNREQWTTLQLKTARYGHSTTYFYGEDETPGTEDDIVIVFGGWDRQQNALDSFELLHPFARQPRFFAPRSIQGENTSRAFHSAHNLNTVSGDLWQSGQESSTPRLLLLGGFQEHDKLTPMITIAELSSDGSIMVTPIASMSHARAHHRSALVQQDETILLFIYGGYGDLLDKNRLVSTTSWTVNTLAAPELFELYHDRNDRLFPLKANRVATNNHGSRRRNELWAPDPRMGHQLVTLNEEQFSLLLVGGSWENPYLKEDRRWPQRYDLDYDYTRCFRIQLAPQDPNEPIQFLEVEPLPLPLLDPAVSLLIDGTTLIAGGGEQYNDDLEFTSTSRVFLFNPVNNDFQWLAGKLNTPRRQPQMVQLNATSWIIVGGSEQSSRPELFDWSD